MLKMIVKDIQALRKSTEFHSLKNSLIICLSDNLYLILLNKILVSELAFTKKMNLCSIRCQISKYMNKPGIIIKNAQFFNLKIMNFQTWHNMDSNSKMLCIPQGNNPKKTKLGVHNLTCKMYRFV